MNISLKSALMVLPVALVIILFGVPIAAAQTFQHPGVLVSKAQLDFIKAQVNAHVEPFYTEFLNAQASSYGSKTYQIQGPYPGGINQCGSNSTPDNGCKAADSDATTAYVQALLWYITGDHAYAQNAIDIMNAYGHNLKGFAGATPGIPCPGDSTTCSNGQVQAAWDATKWPRAAEIIRYSNAGWADADIQAFSDMLKNVYEPLIYDGSGNNGNWELSMIEGMIGIAVFNNDQSLFDHAVLFWHQRVPSYFYYYPIDGNQPQPFPRNTGSTTWNGQVVFDARVNGISQETCRDMKHAHYGISATMNVAETAHIQGINLYESEQPRLLAGLEFNANINVQGLAIKGNTLIVPSYMCSNKHNSKTNNQITLGEGYTFVIGYNEFHNRLGQSLPYTAQWIAQGVLPDPEPIDVGGHMTIFEPLTHYADAGLPPAQAVMTSPAQASTLPASSVPFTWSSATGAQQYWIWIGTTTGGMDLYNQGQGLNTSAVVNELPTNGSPVYVRLFTMLNGTWQFNDYAYTATSPAKAAVTSPTPTSTLPGSSVTFNWSAGAGAQQYWIWIGSTPGGMDLYNQSQALNTSAVVNGLPTNGAPLYVRLFTVLNGAWQWNDYTYTAASPAKAAVTSPVPASTLPGSSVTFNWSAGAGAQQYWIWIGTTPGGMDLYNQGQALNTSATVNALPSNGSPMYVRLFTVLNGAWQWNDYTYTAASPTPAVITSPPPTSTLPSASATFSWSPGIGAQQYWIWIGTTPGGMELYSQGQSLNTSAVVNGLPTNGSPVYVRLFTVLNGAWQWNDYTYTATR